MDANGLEQNVVLSQLKQCRSHMLTQRKRRQKNRLICIQLRLLRTRFEIKDTWIENDFDLFFGGGGGVGGEEVRWKTVRTYGKILATPLDLQSPQLVQHSCSARMIWDSNKVIIIIIICRVMTTSCLRLYDFACRVFTGRKFISFQANALNYSGKRLFFRKRQIKTVLTNIAVEHAKCRISSTCNARTRSR